MVEAVNKVIREPKLLPYYMDAQTAAALVGVSRETIEGYCRRDVWQRGVHYTKPSRRRIFHRDPILAWMNESARRTVATMPHSKVDLARSPELAAEIARQRCPA